MKYYIKIIRISAWLLLLATLISLFSGFFITKNFLTPWIGYQFSYYIHVVFIPFIFVPLFFIHSWGGIYSLLLRKQLLNKKFVKVTILFGWAILFIIFIYFYFAQNFSTNKYTGKTNLISSSTSDQVSINLSLSEISKHNKNVDCWLIINNKVYDISSYLNIHPGGASTITAYCGKDGTKGFADKDRGTPHSNRADSLLNNYYLGDVGQNIYYQKNNVNSSQPSTILNSGDDKNDD